MDEVSALLRLQEIDLKVLRLNKQLDEMPEKRDILTMRAKLADIQGLLDRTEAAGRAVDAKLQRMDDETAGITEKMQAEQAKLLSGEVKNPKELQAISMELDALKRHHDALENEELAVMAQRETASEQEAKVRKVLAAGRRKEAELVDAFKDRGGAIVAEVEKLTAERERLVSSLPSKTRDRYEALREAKHGIAIGMLEGNTCGACRVTLPEDQLERLAAGPRVGECPKCRRMLVVGDAE